MKVQQGVVDYFEQANAYDSIIGSGPYIELMHLKEPASGFLHSDRAFKNVTWDINGQTRYVIFDNIENDYRYQDFKRDSTFLLVYRTERKGIWAEVYKRK
jgi:hypothetical protein